MKETGVCPKCGGSKVLKVDPMRCNAFPIGFTSLAKLERCSAAAADSPKNGFRKRIWKRRSNSGGKRPSERSHG